MATKKLLLIGAGGHAKVVYDALRRGSDAFDLEVRDDNPAFNGQQFFDSTIITPVGNFLALSTSIHIAIGNNRVRAKFGRELQKMGKSFCSIIHPMAILSPDTDIGEGGFASAGTILGPMARIGICVIMNHGAIIDHDCQIGDWVHIAPNATLGGGVRIGEGSLIGAGAVILPGLSIGAWSIIGAGAVVINNVQSGETVVGSPARVIQK